MRTITCYDCGHRIYADMCPNCSRGIVVVQWTARCFKALENGKVIARWNTDSEGRVTFVFWPSSTVPAHYDFNHDTMNAHYPQDDFVAMAVN